MPNVLIPTKLDTVAAEILKDKGFNVVQDADADLSDLIAANPETNFLIVRSEKITQEVIDSLPGLRLVVRAGAGYNTIDTAYARSKDIDVMNTPGANSNAVAEEVVALVLAAYRHVVPADISTRAGKWEKKSFMGREITGKTIGIIGVGHIGQLLVKRLQGFEVNALAFDPILTESMAEEIGVKMATVEEIFEQSDIISLHLPENDHTRGMINKDLLMRMKSGAVVVNCARAGVINEDDFRSVKAEKDFVFCNDVYAADAAGDKSVADIADVMLPHLGASTFEANNNAARKAAEQIVAYVENGVKDAVVNAG